MISSEDVRRVTFDRTVRGYRCEDVDDYLKQVADAMDALAAEHDDMQQKVMVLAQRIDQYRADENTLSTTMLNAQRLGENVIKEAKQKAAEILREANLRAEDREQRARDEVALCQQEIVTLHREADSFKKKLQKMYKEHIELISQLPNYEEPVEPAPEPAAEAPQGVEVTEAVPEPVSEPAPAAEEYEQQQFDAAPGSSYYQTEPQPESEAVDTVEFALERAVDTDDYAPEQAVQPAPAQPPLPTAGPAGETRYVPGAGLYDLPEDDGKDGLGSFSSVDFDS